MNGVFGMLDLALDTELQTEQRHYLERARASADLLLRVINDILDFSKIEAGRLDLEPAPFSLRESLGESIKAFGPRAHRKDLELALHVHPETPDDLAGDAMRLGQVLTNLVGNAIKFTDRGEVVLEAAAWSRRPRGKSACTLPSPTRGPASRPTSSASSSSRSFRRTAPRLAGSGAPGWGWPSLRGWSS
jgi:signal transduction histidine kinase